MIKFDKFVLNNGLKVIVHKDKTTPIVAFNIMYNVGARDEDSSKTGFAHLFEHLMFGGSKNIPVFDKPLQLVGGENNAFTNNDITNYYITLPKENIETAFWLESDRMLSLAFTKKSLEVQRQVVVEEFKQRYLNQPYGDVSLLSRPLAYKTHPYQWSTIGKEISHIENVVMADVKDFFFKHYAPNNAVLVVAGNVETEEIKALSEKWFAPIERRNVPIRNLPQEQKQTEKRILEVVRDVPYDSIYKSFHMCDRKSLDYYTTDIISDVLSNGKSTRLYKELVVNKKLFSEINAYISGSFDPGLLTFSGTLIKGVKMQDAENAIIEEISKIQTEMVSDYELSKLINKIEATQTYSEISLLSRATNLAMFETIDNADMINQEVEKYKKVTSIAIKDTANEILVPENSSTLYYYSQHK